MKSYFKKLYKLPNHLCFIIDGNGRWAKHRGLPRMAGHKAGLDNLQKILATTDELGIKYVSIYAFSCENWNRPQKEVEGLMDLFRKLLNESADKYTKSNIRVRILGDLGGLPKDIEENAQKLMKETAGNDGQNLNFCINYGGRQEIIKAINDLINDKCDHVDVDMLKSRLYTAGMPDPDLVVRTSGERRTSNFMPFQCTYSEWAFPKVLWPNFTDKCLYKVLKDYQKRDRRYGAIKENK